MTTEILCDMPWHVGCPEPATHAYLLFKEEMIHYRCKRHKLRFGFADDIKEISIDEAVIFEVMRK